MNSINGIPSVKYRRKILGMSAILLPFDQQHNVDWPAMKRHVERTFAAGLVPAVNMDTGYANLIDDATREKVLEITRDIASGRDYIAGCFVGDGPGANFDLDGYASGIEQIENYGGQPILFQSYGLTSGTDDSIVDNYVQISKRCDRFYAFELGTMFAPFGKIYSLDVFRSLMEIPECVGAKHSSLHRQPEWDRLLLRDQARPDFRLLTGNDLAIDMVMYGSDYLLGLSTFAPDLFAKRDEYWLNGDPQFYELNDWLQYLGNFAFRHPTSAYKHSAAQFLHLRGWIETALTHPQSLSRPEYDVPILNEIAKQLDVFGGSDV